MTKEERIEAIEKELAILKQECKEEKEFKFFPQEDDKCYSFKYTGELIDFTLDDTYYSKIHSIYKTKQEAEKARSIAVAKHKLKQIIEWKNNGWKPDLEDEEISKYCFYKYRNDINIDHFYIAKHQPSWLYMKDKQTAEWILDNYRDLVEIVLGE